MRGPQGIPGPPGPRGPAGDAGDTGKTGATGRQGAAGAAGAKGKRGATGSAGAAARSTPDRHETFLDVSRQIDRIHKELKIQLQRMAQIQVEVDQLKTKIKHLK